MSKIEWTERTWNPIVGCSIISPGCTNCYAMKMAARIEKMNRTGGSGSNYVNHYDGTTKRVNGNVVWTGKLALAPEKTLLAPLGRKQPTKYFVNSMGDLFHEDCPNEWIDRVFAVMALCPQHTFQVLTKRAERMRDYLAFNDRDLCIGAQAINIECELSAQSEGYKRDVLGRGPLLPLPNVWLGVSCERQQEADERIPLLLQTPAAVRFISAEPLLGPIDIIGYVGRFGWQSAPGDVRSLDWVIAGGESGRGARPMHPDWARSLRDQCSAAGVAYFFKQHGEWREPQGEEAYDTSFGRTGKPPAFIIHDDGTVHCFQWPGMYQGRAVIRVGKKAAGRLLDGREHNDYPQVRA